MSDDVAWRSILADIRDEITPWDVKSWHGPTVASAGTGASDSRTRATVSCAHRSPGSARVLPLSVPGTMVDLLLCDLCIQQLARVLGVSVAATEETT